jgi:hypothetical protein
LSLAAAAKQAFARGEDGRLAYLGAALEADFENAIIKALTHG